MIELHSADVDLAIEAHGARIARLATDDRDGRRAEVVVGLAPEAYRKDEVFLGATVGRYANRIAGGAFVLDGRRYVLPRNEPNATLHGGPGAFDHADFVADPVREVPGGQSVTLHHTSPDGENGFPATLHVAVTYTVTGHEVAVTLAATSDATTVVNLTNHAYWNLRGAPGDIGEHEITVFADRYLPIDEDLVPDGAPAPVAGTALDLTTPTPFGTRVHDPHPQLRRADGLDLCYVLRGNDTDAGLPVAAVVREPRSGRTLTLLTDQPGLQVYSGNRLDGSVVDHAGNPVPRFGAFCLEPQQFPDAPNRPDFPSAVLHPGETRLTRIVARFGTDG